MQWSNAEVLTDLNDIRLQQSDVICTCTASKDALIDLKQIKPDAHINGKGLFLLRCNTFFFSFHLAIGSFRANMRELADDIMLSSTTRIIVDSRDSAINEAGEIIQSKV